MECALNAASSDAQITSLENLHIYYTNISFTEERFFVLDNDGRKNAIKTSAKILFFDRKICAKGKASDYI